MDERRARLRINLAQREFEVEGSESFVKAYAERLDQLLARLTQPSEMPSRAAPESEGPADTHTFGELIQRLPRAATDVDRMLVAGYFAQRNGADHGFGTGEANTLLTEQGVKVGNPSQCVKQNLLAKRVFKHQGRYRVSQIGLDYLRQLIGTALPG
ncbi:MAG TPA: hypothetical protein VE592_03640 [Geminicoccaceae bacterium]|nr:hypothetical protein [Geminicoccaceae bacterium]